MPSIDHSPTATGLATGSPPHPRDVSAAPTRDEMSPTPTRFGVGLVREPDVDVILLRGPLDILAALWIDRNGRPATRPGTCFVIDCADVTFIDGAGVGVLLRLLDGPHHRLANVPAKVDRLLRLLDLGHLVDDSVPRASSSPAP
jgi:anti-anti-sigma regulatory factor